MQAGAGAFALTQDERILDLLSRACLNRSGIAAELNLEAAKVQSALWHLQLRDMVAKMPCKLKGAGRKVEQVFALGPMAKRIALAKAKKTDAPPVVVGPPHARGYKWNRFAGTGLDFG